MHSSYEQIDAQWERLMAETGMPLSAVCKAGWTAVMQHDAGLAIRAHCPSCGGLLKATELNLGTQGTATLISCRCGRSKNFLSPPPAG